MRLKNIEIDHLKKHAYGGGKLSLDTFVGYLEKVEPCDAGKTRPLPRVGLDVIKTVEQQAGKLDKHHVDAYREVFEMIQFLQNGLRLSEKDYWALAHPIPQEAFYGTDAIYSLLDAEAKLIADSEKQTHLQPMRQLLHGVILERFYGIPNGAKELLYQVKQAGVYHYYMLEVDFSFVDIQRKGKLPTIDLTSLRDKGKPSVADLEPILQLLDPKNFTFSGFTIIQFQEKTTDYVLERLHRLINELPQYKQESFLTELQEILLTFAGSTDISSALLPLLELNGYPLLSTYLVRDSVFFRELQKRKASGEMEPAMASYLEKPYPIVYGLEKSLDTKDPAFRRLIKREGLASYICTPLIHRDKLVGFFELYSYRPDALNPATMLIWHKVVPLLTQLATEIISVFKNGLDQIILQNYTALNPAVEWRFNVVAARQLAAYMRGEQPVMEKVRFEKVYPIYGAIDVRNSTQLRNSIERKDSLAKIAQVTDFLSGLEGLQQEERVECLINRMKRAKQWMEGSSYSRYLQETFLFLNEELYEGLEQLRAEQPEISTAVARFIKDYRAVQGGQSDIFEVSLQRLNKLIKAEIQQFNALVQEIFPAYFELFRSDGIEYDMYVGQSITPTRRFDQTMLREIRKQQLISMARIGRRAAELVTALPVAMRVTLLVFVHSNTIDISFREDERRFDVEGSYNIRYQMVKKRIDKVRIKGSGERLVRPDTLAIVFQSEELEVTIAGLLQEVVAEGWLKSDFEFCTLEDIQGLSEMQAVRAKIVLTDDKPIP